METRFYPSNAALDRSSPTHLMPLIPLKPSKDYYLLMYFHQQYLKVPMHMPDDKQEGHLDQHQKDYACGLSPMVPTPVSCKNHGCIVQFLEILLQLQLFRPRCSPIFPVKIIDVYFLSSFVLSNHHLLC